MWFNPTMIWLLKSRWACWDLWLWQGWCKHSVNYGMGKVHSSKWPMHLGYAQAPAMLFAVLLNDMILAGVHANMIAGHPYAFTAAMNGEFGLAAVNDSLGLYVRRLYFWHGLVDNHSWNDCHPARSTHSMVGGSARHALQLYPVVLWDRWNGRAMKRGGRKISNIHVD